MSGTDDHYFTAEPASAAERRTVVVQLAGRAMPVTTAGGVFSPDRVDIGTTVLLRVVPDPPPTGNVLDLGCGWGPLALTMALTSPEATVWAVDVNRRAIGLLADNAKALGLENVRPVTADQVPGNLTFATIWSNPPIRIGKAALHELLDAWLPRLSPGGTAYLVVQRNLGADSLHTWLTGHLGPEYYVTKYASSKGFRVLRVHRDPGTGLGDPA
jgi:16S rRNA (guanine1207-N2)-methyltransferase